MLIDVPTKLKEIKEIMKKDGVLTNAKVMEYIMFYLNFDIDDILKDLVGTQYYLPNGGVQEVTTSFIESLMQKTGIPCPKIHTKFQQKKILQQIDF